MGAWAVDSFGNDDACDWVYELEESESLELVEETLDAAIAEGEEYLEAPTACMAIAAMEVVALLRGHAAEGVDYPEEVETWVEQHEQDVPDQLLARALTCHDRILADESELRDLWAETEHWDAWKQHMADLRQRMSG